MSGRTYKSESVLVLSPHLSSAHPPSPIYPYIDNPIRRRVPRIPCTPGTLWILSRRILDRGLPWTSQYGSTSPTSIALARPSAPRRPMLIFRILRETHIPIRKTVRITLYTDQQQLLPRPPPLTLRKGVLESCLLSDATNGPHIPASWYATS